MYTICILSPNHPPKKKHPESFPSPITGHLQSSSHSGATRGSAENSLVPRVQLESFGCFRKWWVFPPQHHPILIGFSIIFTIHFGGVPTIFGNTHLGSICWWFLLRPTGFEKPTKDRKHMGFRKAGKSHPFSFHFSQFFFGYFEMNQTKPQGIWRSRSFGESGGVKVVKMMEL